MLLLLELLPGQDLEPKSLGNRPVSQHKANSKTVCCPSGRKKSGFCYESVVQPHLAVSPERILSLDY